MFLCQITCVRIVCEGCKIELSLNIYGSQLTKSHLKNEVMYAPIRYRYNYGL